MPLLAVAGLVASVQSVPHLDFTMRAATAFSGPPTLSVSGNQLMAAGQSIQLHGANMSGTEFVCAQNWTNDPFGGAPEDDPRTFAAMKSWGINAVRIPLNEDCWLGINGVQIGGAAYQGAIIKLVRDLEAAGMYVIVDLHWSAPGAQRALSQNAAPDSDHSVSFWQQVASAFGSDGAVMFDLFNEPYFYWIADGTSAFDCLWNGCMLRQYVTGGSPYTVPQSWRSAGFSQLISVIRSTHARNVIMAAGADWANDLSGWASHMSADPNVIASWHSYPGQACSSQTCWNSVIVPIAQRRPIVVGETGDNSSPPLQFMPTFLPWADQHGISYLPWTWNAWADAANVLVGDMKSGTPTGGEGTYYRAHLAVLGGSNHIPTTPVPVSATGIPTTPTATPTPTRSSTQSKPTPARSQSPLQTPGPVPPPGSAPQFNDDFGSARLGSAPPGWRVEFGDWKVAARPMQVLAHGQYGGLISAGGSSWSDYQIVALLQPVQWAPGALGVAFRYVDSMDYYSCEVRNNDMLYLSRYIRGVWTQLGYAAIDAPGGAWLSVTARASGDRLSCALNGHQLVGVADSTFVTGKIALLSNNYGNFGRVTVTP